MAHRERRHITCAHCQTVFETVMDHGKWPRYCSRACFDVRGLVKFDPEVTLRMFVDDLIAPSTIAKNTGVSKQAVFKYLRQQVPDFEERLERVGDGNKKRRAERWYEILFSHPEWSLNEAAAHFGVFDDGALMVFLKKHISKTRIDQLSESRVPNLHERRVQIVNSPERRERNRTGLRTRTGKHTGHMFFEDLTEEQRNLLVELFQEKVTPVYIITKMWREKYECYVMAGTLVRWLKRLLGEEAYAFGRGRIIRREGRRQQTGASTTDIYRPGVMDNRKHKGPGSKHRTGEFLVRDP